MEAYAHTLRMFSIHESSQYKPHIAHSLPGKGPISFVVGGFLAETAEAGSKKTHDTYQVTLGDSCGYPKTKKDNA